MAKHFANMTTGDEVPDMLIGCIRSLDSLRECVISAVSISIGKRAEESSVLQGFMTKHDALVAELRKLAVEVTGNGLRSTDGGHHVQINGINYR